MSDPSRVDFQPFFAPLFGPNPKDQATCRAYVDEGLCPICGAGPFAVVAIHSQRMHDLDRFALREMLGVYKATSICDEGYSAARRLRSKRQWTEKRAAALAEGRRLRSGGPRQLSKAAKDRNRALSLANRDRAIALLQQSVDRRKDVTRLRDKEMRSKWDEGLSLAEIASVFGVLSKTVRESLVRVGVDIGNEARRRKSYSLIGARDAQAAAAERRRSQRSERFIRLGGDWLAVRQMAADESVTVKSMREFLKRAGASLPDGRSRGA